MALLFEWHLHKATTKPTQAPTVTLAESVRAVAAALTGCPLRRQVSRTLASTKSRLAPAAVSLP